MLSSTVISAVGLTCKAFLNSGLCSIAVSNLPILLDALGSDRRHSGQGLVTVSNHLSTLDDPLTWGILPFKYFTRSHTIRWVLGASDIMFTNPLCSEFFRQGQVIETFRGNGIWQPALDVAIEKLNEGHWLHMFSEGKVYQSAAYSQTDGIAYLPRFKWGVGRMVMETKVPPLIIPVWLTGFDKLMPEHRPFPFKYFPRLGIQLGITFGDPILPDNILAALNGICKPKSCSLPPSVTEGFIPVGEPSSGSGPRNGLRSRLRSPGWMEGGIIQAGGDPFVKCESAEFRAYLDEIRSEVTAIIQRAVEDLGRKTSGNGLGLPLSRQAGRSEDCNVR